MSCKSALMVRNLVLHCRAQPSEKEDLLVSVRCAPVRRHGSQQPFSVVFPVQEDVGDSCVLVPMRSSI